MADSIAERAQAVSQVERSYLWMMPGSLVRSSLFAVACSALSCAASDLVITEHAPAPALQQIASGLSTPLLVTAPTNDARLFIVEKRGRVRIVKNGQLLPTPFLDISSLVSTGSEQGLLGLAFHPHYATNGVFVVDYTDVSGNTHVVSYKVSANPDVANAASAYGVLAVAQPYANHNGGHVVFGPDGMLFVGMGDGGSGGDPQGHGQNANDLLGSLLRLQINDDGRSQIPPDNPYVGQAGKRAEPWNIGLRNPWRFSFDRATGDLYIADVGQGYKEELDIAPSPALGKGANYGWNIYEGTSCYNSVVSCNASGLTMPSLEYTHADGCSIIGGFVYRGVAMPQMVGNYFYADYCGGWVKSIRYAGGAVSAVTSWPAFSPGTGITSFGEDAAGELYVMTESGGVWRMVMR